MNKILVSYIFLASCLTGFAQSEVRLLSPENEARVTQPRPHFHWEGLEPDPMEGAYQIQIGSKREKKAVANEILKGVSRYVPVKALPPGEYIWRVRKAPDGAWSEVRNFEVKAPIASNTAAGSPASAWPAQSEVRLLFPENGAILYQPQPNFRWESLAPDPGGETYQFQIAWQGKKLVANETLEGISRYVSGKALPPGTYGWRVRTAPDGAWSKVRKFEVKKSANHKVARVAPVRRRPAQTEITLTSPEDGATIYAPHPHLHWQKEDGTNLEDYYRIQVASDEAFQSLVIDDKLDAVSRLVSVKPLATGKYFWRVRREDQQQWSKVFSFTRGESAVYPIKTGATTEEIEAVFREAAANTPARVLFEQGDYLIARDIKLEKVRDLIIDGNGSKLTLKNRLLELNNCADITVCNMTVTPEREASTNVDILEVDPDAGTLTVQVQPGFPQDFPAYFPAGKRGNTIMRVVNEKHRGLAIGGWGSGGKRMDDLGNGRYRIHNVKAKELKDIRPGMVAYAKTYNGGLGKAYYVTRTTLSKINFMGMGGSIWMSREMNANSSLSCGFLPLTPKHYTGASGVIGKGRTGSWYEDCRFEMGADDNTMDHVQPVGVADIQGNVAILQGMWPWKQDIRKGEEFVLWDCMSGETGPSTSVIIMEVQSGDGKPIVSEELNFRAPGRLVLSKNAAELNRELGRPEGTSFQAPPGKSPAKAMDKMLLMRLSHNNQDFVFRHNEVTGGSAGLLNNTTRALVAHNTFRNLRGYGVAAGYLANANEFPIAGAGSRDYVIRDNTMVNVGRTAIRASAKHRFGRNIIVKNNTISYTADRAPLYAITLGVPGCVVKDNLFKCPLPPEKGAWVRSGSGDNAVLHSNNRAEPEHPGVQLVQIGDPKKSKKKK